MKNHNEFVKNINERTLTAKGYKFIEKCLNIIAEHKGVHRLSKEFKETKDKFKKIVIHLFIDRMYTDKQIIELIKSRKYLN